MKKTLTMILLALVCSIAAQAHEAEYQPLVREGVVWHYRYCAWDFSYGYIWEDIKMQFKGDSILNGIDYKKCYFYMEDKLPEGSQPFCLAREEDKKVMFCGFKHEVLDTLGAALYYLRGYTDIGETIAYDFGNMQDFVYQIGEEDAEIQSVSESETDVNGHPAKRYHVSGLGIYEADLIEGVGGDGKNIGFLFGPLTIITTCTFCSLPGGLIKLTDLDGNLLYKGASYDEFYANQTPADYQPLVCEGVVWHYAYHHFVDEGMGAYTTIQRVQFKGDTIVNGVNYKKCFFYDTVELDESDEPLCCAREENGKVMFTAFRHAVLDTLCNLFPAFGLPSEHFDENGEVIVYDFGDMRAFVDNINEKYEGLFAQIQSENTVLVGGQPAKSYKILVDGCYPCSLIEGVGPDGMNTGYLFAPFTLLSTGFGPWPIGLVKLTDLDGHLLYKGACFDVIPSCDINGDALVDISDVNGVINMILGKGDQAPVDITGDGRVDIADVNAVINEMLGK